MALESVEELIMNQQTQPLPREHHFYVAIAKFIFHHPEHGIVSVQDPIKIKDAERYGLSPIILYGLTVAGLPIQWMTFTTIDQPMSFRDILQDAWRHAKGLRGRADILRINRSIALASPGLVEEMAKAGVQVKIMDSKDKALPASLRSAQKNSQWLPRKHDENDRSITASIKALCRYAQNKHDLLYNCGGRGFHSRKDSEKIQQWLAMPAQVPTATATATATDGLDWTPGPWLSSWEAPLPPDQPRHFKLGTGDFNTWLLTGEKAPVDTVENDDIFVDCDYDNAAEITKHLVACWPNPPAEIANCIGTTLRELQWFISEKAPLAPHLRINLENLLGIEYDESIGEYIGTGPYILIARKPLAIKKLHEVISDAWDAQSCEIIPHQGAADPSWRYILINKHETILSIMMAPRGAKATEFLPKLLTNYNGATSVPIEFYRDVTSTCARACIKTTANIREMTGFIERFEKHWTGHAWQLKTDN